MSGMFMLPRKAFISKPDLLYFAGPTKECEYGRPGNGFTYHLWFAEIYISVLLLGGLLNVALFPQETDNVKSELFREFDAAMKSARQEEVPILLPNLYAKTMELYKARPGSNRREGLDDRYGPAFQLHGQRHLRNRLQDNL